MVWCERGEFMFDAAPIDPLGASPVIRGPERAPAAEALAMVGAHRSTPMAQRTALIAYGANRAPERLKEKLGALKGPQSVVPILKARLTGFDIVFSAHFTSYGAIPATLGYRPGVTIDISVLFVDDQQLAMLDASESVGVNYERRSFEDLDLLIDGLGLTPTADAYVSLHGCFDPGEGRALALSAIPAENRDLPAANVVEALNAARQKIAMDVLLDDFIAALAGDAAFRARATKVLTDNAIGRPHR